MIEFTTRKLSEKFVQKVNLCLLAEKNCNEWIWSFIQERKSLLEIAKHYNVNYDGEYLKATCCGLFDAYIHFKENKEFDTIAASYLSERSGVLGSFVIKDKYDKFVDMINFTVVDLISELDGEEFFTWLDNLARIGYKTLYPEDLY